MTTKKNKVTVKNLTKGVKASVKKMKANRKSQIANRGVVEPRNAMVNGMVKSGPVAKTEVINAILSQYPTTSVKMASRTITRGKNKKYNDKYTKFEKLIIEQKINGVSYLAFTQKAFAELKKQAKQAEKGKTKGKGTTKSKKAGKSEKKAKKTVKA